VWLLKKRTSRLLSQDSLAGTSGRGLQAGEYEALENSSAPADAT
jgi:hypothetical protein